MRDDELNQLGEGDKDLIVLHDGRMLVTHGPDNCGGPNCCIHRPSDHPLNAAPLVWVAQSKMMFRVCKHGKIHPDPDDIELQAILAYCGYGWGYDGWHPCCEEFCCSSSNTTPDTV